jgi:putative transposase
MNMARPKRLGLKGISQHLIQRGNNRRLCFTREFDRVAYISWLKEYSAKYNVAIHAWVLMSNHVHLLCTPLAENNGVSLMMQSLGRKYVRYFNDTHQQSGTLWEGRFKASLVCSDSYMLSVYRYIELNPVRANMVSHPAQYKWSSYHFNAHGKQSELCQPHNIYIGLGADPNTRQRYYRKLFEGSLSEAMTKKITDSVNRELVMGNEQFKAQVQTLSGVKLKSARIGRPPKK